MKNVLQEQAERAEKGDSTDAVERVPAASASSASSCSKSGSQLELFAGGITEAHVEDLLRLLRAYGWLTRRQLGPLTGWTERSIRAVAESGGARIVRGPRGFHAIEKCNVDEITHCARIAIAQGAKMTNYGHALLKRAHERIA